MKNENHIPYVSWGLFGICLLCAVITSMNDSMYEYFAYWSKPKYIWQMISGIFLHGSKNAPNWYLWVHFGTNMLMIVPLGSVIERRLGTRRIFELFLTAWIVCSVVFKLCFLQEQQTGTGISAIGYSFGPVAYWLLIREYKSQDMYRF